MRRYISVKRIQAFLTVALVLAGIAAVAWNSHEVDVAAKFCSGLSYTEQTAKASRVVGSTRTLSAGTLTSFSDGSFSVSTDFTTSDINDRNGDGDAAWGSTLFSDGSSSYWRNFYDAEKDEAWQATWFSNGSYANTRIGTGYEDSATQYSTGETSTTQSLDGGKSWCMRTSSSETELTPNSSGSIED